MKTRHRAREIALQALYQFSVAATKDAPPAEPHILVQEIQQYFEHFQIPESTRKFSAELIAGTIQKRSELDPKIESHTHHWRLDRLAQIDAWLLRMATYELIHCTDIPASVTIDEAIELAKEFGAAETPGFINGVLDAIRIELGKN